MAQMRAITAASFAVPSSYQLSEVPVPTVTGATDVVIKVKAASVNPVDIKLAAGAFKAVLSETFPLRIGYDCAGIVTAIGAGVTRVKVGDEVYVRLPEVSKGSWAEYTKCDADQVALKPPSLSFSDAASLPLAAMTAIQALRRYEGSLEGKTVFVPGGLSGTGVFACQLAKRYFKAGKVITTVSTAKIPKLPELLGEDVVDQVIDYTKNDPRIVIPTGTVDFLLDTMGQSMQFLSLMRPSTSKIISISTTPSWSQLQNASFFKRPNSPRIPFYAGFFLDAVDQVRKFRARRWHVSYEYMFLSSAAEELETLSKAVENGAVRPVVGRRVKLGDVDAVRDACMQVYHGKGGIGKTVIEVD